MITDYKDTYRNGTCVIVGNGPSLNTVPLDFLYQYPTYGQNKIYMLEGFTPTFYVCTDPSGVIDRDTVNEMQTIRFTRRGTGFKYTNEFVTTNRRYFSTRPDIEVYEGYCVTFISLQLAYYMGFSTVLLVGVDARYVEGEENHFAEGYGDPIQWDDASMDKGRIAIDQSMAFARNAFEKDGRKIINLTEGTALKVFELGTISDWMPEMTGEGV